MWHSYSLPRVLPAWLQSGVEPMPYHQRLFEKVRDIPTGQWKKASLSDFLVFLCDRDPTTTVLIIDPETDSAESTTITGLSSATYKYVCMVLAPNGKIYCAPTNARDKMLIINPGIAKHEITPLLSPYRNGWTICCLLMWITAKATPKNYRPLSYSVVNCR